MNLLKFFSLIVGGILCFSCIGTDTSKAVSLVGEWKVTAIEKRKLPTDFNGKQPYIGFLEDEQIYGNCGCNHLMGKYTTDSLTQKLHFTNIGITRLICPNMEVERKILSVLDKVVGYKTARDATVLHLLDENGRVLLSLKKEAE